MSEIDRKLKLVRRSIMNDSLYKLFIDPESVVDPNLIARYLDAQISLSTAYENILSVLKRDKLPSCEVNHKLRETSRQYLDSASHFADIEDQAREKVREIYKFVNQHVERLGCEKDICQCRHYHIMT